jgi:hypothetical protein
MIYIHIQMISTDNTIRTLESTAVSVCFKIGPQSHLWSCGKFAAPGKLKS